MPAVVRRVRELPCVVCGRVLYASSVTTTHPEAPEMIHLYEENLWVGIVTGDDGKSPRLLIACQPECLKRLLPTEESS